MLSFITLPTDLVATVSVYSGDVFTSLIPLGAIVIGIALGMYFLNWGISKFRGRRGRR